MDLSTVPAFNTFEWSSIRTCCSYARLWIPKVPNTIKAWKSWKTSIAQSLTMDSGVCCWEPRAHHVWERQYLLEFAMGFPARMGELLHTQGEGELLCLPEIQLSCCKLGLLKCAMPGMGHTPWEESEGEGPVLAYSTPSPSPHAWWGCLP